MSLQRLPQFDGDNVVSYSASADLPDLPITLAEKREVFAAARRLIQAKYDAGIPLFTKDLFRDVVRQLDSDDTLDQKVSVVGLDGRAVHFPIETGKEFPHRPYGDDYVSIITKPLLNYSGLEHLVASKDPILWSARLAYLPVELIHSIEVRHVQTNKLMDLWRTADYAIVKLRFAQAKRSLQASELFAQLKSTLTSAAVPPGIDKIVALACCTMTRANGGFMPSMAQHILALTIRDILTNGLTTCPNGEVARDIKCYAQDPIYTPVDKQVLSEAGFTVVDDPRAFLEIDEASVVITIAPDIPVRQIVADIARPAIMIWNKVIVQDPKFLWTDPVSPRVKQMVEGYIELPFPAEPENQKYFGNPNIYVRKGEWARK